MQFSQIIKESLERPNKLKQTNRIRMNEIFLNEDKMNPDSVSKDVLNKIEHNLFEKPNPNSFAQALSKSKHQEMLTDYSPEELSQMKLFKLK